ncbi:MAG TPA: hypothetical protein VIH84_05215 [Candidatus Methylomirabilis sp.]
MPDDSARVRFQNELLASVRKALKNSENGSGVSLETLQLWWERNRGKRPGDTAHAVRVLIGTKELLEGRNEKGEVVVFLPPSEEKKKASA